MLNAQWLHTFKTLVEVGHFTQTAERLFMTQPGVTQQIKKLEEACGHALLKREGKRFSLTEQGRLVYQHAQTLAAQETRLHQQLSFDDPHAGVCRIACSGALALSLYPPLLQRQARHPALVMQLEVAPKDSITRAVSAGTIDIGIVTQAPDDPALEAQQIGSEIIQLILPAQAEAAAPVSADLPAILRKLGLIRHPDVEHYLALYLAQCGDAALQQVALASLPVHGYVNQLQQILLPVAQGLGFTVLPARAVKAFAAPEQLRVWQSPREVSEPLYLLQRRGRELPARFAPLLKQMAQWLALAP
ncbi:LysR family transcriptional regulator [Atopomonas sediminilitoris]|uniref:LysR family transcriptional regulator n=1 Tax=Atopomonas sediminilitoris TaxID=2919919 RepID=UPI001F4DA0E3|nr:LysR family transcriptional regulator [Atopomonas sediminilitoris]MCJ8169585.1 LysR family transcriptional regulator [Atopomonas sediminilitoris]